MVPNERLAELRKQKSLTQAEVAEALDVSFQAVSRWERGAAHPSVENLIKLSQLYQVDLGVLIGEEAPLPEEPEPPAETGQEAQANSSPPYMALRYILRTVCFLAVCAVVCVLVLTLSRSQKVKEEMVPISGLKKEDIQILPEDYIELNP